jgi:hypothetical protein
LSFVVIDQYLTEFWALGLRIFMKIGFPDIFLINFSDIEMKLGMIVYNNKLKIKLEFRHYWLIFDRVMALWLRIFMKSSVFRTFFGWILQILKWNLVWLFTIMSYRSILSFVVIDQYLTELWPLDLECFGGYFSPV